MYGIAACLKSRKFLRQLFGREYINFWCIFEEDDPSKVILFGVLRTFYERFECAINCCLVNMFILEANILSVTLYRRLLLILNIFLIGAQHMKYSKLLHQSQVSQDWRKQVKLAKQHTAVLIHITALKTTKHSLFT